MSELRVHENASWLAWLLEAALLVDNRGVASSLAEQLAPASGTLATGTGQIATCVDRHLGAAAHRLGDRDDAFDCYARALDVCKKVGFRPGTALTRLQLAELLLSGSAGDDPIGDEQRARAEALAHLDFAIEEFQVMKMQPSLERALRHKGLLHA